MGRRVRALDRVELDAVPLKRERAHEGVGEIAWHRLTDDGAVDGQLNFIDVAVLPPGTSVGRHTHAADEEEYYLFLDGTGRMVRDGESFEVWAGMLVRNPPGSTHEVHNDADADLRMFVFEVRV